MTEWLAKEWIKLDKSELVYHAWTSVGLLEVAFGLWLLLGSY